MPVNTDIDCLEIIKKHITRIKADPSTNHILEDSNRLFNELFTVFNQAKPVQQRSKQELEAMSISALPWETDKSGTGILDRSGALIAVCFEQDQNGQPLPSRRNAQFILNCVTGFRDMSRRLSELEKNVFAEETV